MSDDPVHDLLERAFAADQRRAQAPDLAPSVVDRIRRRQRLRMLLIGGAALVGLGMVLLSAAPVLSMLDAWLRIELSALLSSAGLSPKPALLPDAALMAIAALAAAGWLILLEENPV